MSVKKSYVSDINYKTSLKITKKFIDKPLDFSKKVLFIVILLKYYLSVYSSVLFMKVLFIVILLIVICVKFVYSELITKSSLKEDNIALQASSVRHSCGDSTLLWGAAIWFKDIWILASEMIFGSNKRTNQYIQRE